ncbi:preprotein translocase subunit SecE [Baekduia soli]|uniref:Protein translocase subunit SecE n=1 Tax=Baekduia soli TaxID=496014 RepID=A0A5B8UBW3_9ACTN|nr:preprotein translocase subunit SecE [Baekduia soli]QEC50318.1 preprotein translocase subunit SecE [Baekduia soli]
MAPDRPKREPASSNPSGPAPTEPHRENVPGELDHASGEVEGFEAALVSGAGGEPDTETDDAELERAATASVGDLDDDGDVDDEDRQIAARGARSPARPRGGPRFIGFLGACWAELQRVQWPDRRQVFQATGVVIGFVIIAGAYLGVADWLARKVVDLVL